MLFLIATLLLGFGHCEGPKKDLFNDENSGSKPIDQLNDFDKLQEAPEFDTSLPCTMILVHYKYEDGFRTLVTWEGTSSEIRACKRYHREFYTDIADHFQTTVEDYFKMKGDISSY